MIALDAITLFDMGFGPRMLPVTVLGGKISGASDLREKVMGKAPGRLVESGWIGASVNDGKVRCHDYQTAKLWKEEWGANVGFVVGDGYVVLDNDQGKEFSDAIRKTLAGIGVPVLRKYVLSPKHDRDAFFLRVLDFIGDGAPVANSDLVFRKGTALGKLQLLAQHKQAVIAGTHRDTKCPYVWEATLESMSFEDIPTLSEARFWRFWREFVDRLTEMGWTLEKGVIPAGQASLVTDQLSVSTVSRKLGTPRVLAAGGIAGGVLSTTPSDPTLVASRVNDAKALLDLLPNRVTPPGESPTPFDQWVTDYANWTGVAYRLASHLGREAAVTPAAESLWVDWSHGRPQPKQDPRAVWKSVLAQELRYSSISLVSLAQEFGVLAPAPFPDIDPNDPLLAPTPTPEWDKYRGEWALYNPRGAAFVNLITCDLFDRQSFSDKFKREALALAREIKPGRKPKERVPSFADLFAGQPDRKEVSGMTYAPGGGKLVDGVLNRWNPTTAPRVSVAPDKVKPWLDLVDYVMGPERDRFVKWCAFVAQCPELKPNWHYLVMTDQGTGKDTMMAPVKAAVGDGNYKTEGAYALGGSFNDIFETKLLVVGETSQPKWESHEVNSRLKSVMSRPPNTVWINAKYLPRYEVVNCVAVVLFSNELVPMQLDRGQRRVHVINRRGLKPKPPSYYQATWDWLDQGGTELAAAYLLTLPLTDAEKQEFIGGVAPESNAKAALEQQGVHPALDVLEGLIEDARNGMGPLASLLTTEGFLVEQIDAKLRNKSTPLMVRGWLQDKELRQEGVRRLRKGPGNQCGVIAIKGARERLWVLADKAPDGREWNTFTDAEILAMWQGRPLPKSAKVLTFPDKAPPPEEDLI